MLQPTDIFPASHAKAQKVISKADANHPQRIFMEKSDTDQYVNLMTTALSDVVVQMGKVMDAMVTGALQIQGEAAPSQPQEIKERLTADVNKAVLVLSNIREFTFQAARRYEDNWVDTSIQPINEPPEVTATNVNTTVPDSCLKHCLIFKGTDGDQPEELQAFFQSIFDVSKTSGLTQATTIKLVQRRCTGVARAILDQYIDTLDDLDAEGALLKVILFMESKFSLGWSPSVCKAELQGLSQKYKNCKNYVALQAKILKLAHLASLGEPKDDRDVFRKSNELPVFQSCLSSTDKDIILRLEAQRKSSSQPSLTLGTAVNLLLQYHADRQAQQQPDGAHSINSLENNVESDQVLFVRQSDSSQRKGQRTRSASGQRNAFRQQSRSRDLGRDGGRDSGRDAGPARPQRPGDQQRQRQEQPRSQSAKPGDQPLWKRLGISKFMCPRCCSNGHYHINDSRCVFANTQIPPSPCQRCLKSGFHFSNLCEKITQPPIKGQAGGSRATRGRGTSRPRGTPSSRGRSTQRSSAARRLAEPVRTNDRTLLAQEAQDDSFKLPETGFYLQNQD